MSTQVFRSVAPEMPAGTDMIAVRQLTGILLSLLQKCTCSVAAFTLLP